MKKNRARKRTLTFERLETKAAPAALLIALAPADDGLHERAESSAESRVAPIAEVDTSGNWQFAHSPITLLRFVEENTYPHSQEATVCSAPTWDECSTADEMMQLKDADLQALVIAQAFPEVPENWV